MNRVNSFSIKCTLTVALLCGYMSDNRSYRAFFKPKSVVLVLYGEQIRAARALLGWSQSELAESADVAQITVRRFEASNGPVSGKIESLIRIQSALETAGINLSACRWPVRGGRQVCHSGEERAVPG